ncbi:MAG: hypothetical protein LBK73_03145 [Treponema sp.]|jgi:hypothetical protein|nr:hypothetical protein [Treponema sp.]
MNRQNIQTLANDLHGASGCVASPFDVVKIARHVGVTVYDEKLPQDISGILDVRNEPVILNQYGDYSRGQEIILPQLQSWL